MHHHHPAECPLFNLGLRVLEEKRVEEYLFSIHNLFFRAHFFMVSLGSLVNLWQSSCLSLMSAGITGMPYYI